MLEDCDAQWQAVAGFFDALGERMDRMPALTAGAAAAALGDNQDQDKKEGELA